MKRRGHTFMLIMLVIAMGAAAGAVFLSRFSLEQRSWHEDQLRVQALWLARSALDAGVQGQREVSTELGEAVVEVQGAGHELRVQVTLQGAQASVQFEPYMERFEHR